MTDNACGLCNVLVTVPGCPVHDSPYHHPSHITSKAELKRLARMLRVRPDWHEPDEQDLTARTVGKHFDNAGGNSLVRQLERGHFAVRASERDEIHVVLTRNNRDVAYMNLASLLAWACES